jgi:hypothetical protein
MLPPSLLLLLALGIVDLLSCALCLALLLLLAVLH